MDPAFPGGFRGKHPIRGAEGRQRQTFGVNLPAVKTILPAISRGGSSDWPEIRL
jgi:hypothetical protein